MSGTPSAGSGIRVFRRLSGVSALVPVAVTLVLLAPPQLATADVIPPDRLTNWNPGIPGGIPNYTTVCATVNASDYGNGALDATAGIQAAINGCPAGQVVKLSAGIFSINGTDPVTIDKGIVLRGAGPQATKLLKTSPVANPLILIGRRWLEEAGSVNLTANAPKGATSVQVTSAAGFGVGQLVLVDEKTDDSYVYWGNNCPPGDPCRGWFTRFDRPVGQMVEIASISGNTVSFTTALHIALDTAHTAQLTRWTIPYGAKYAGIEDLYVRGGQDDNITVRFAMYSWVRGVESDWSIGDSFALDTSFRCVLRDSYAHDTPDPFPGGAGYMLSIATYTSESLVENSIFIKGNKVMVMRASGGGNVIAYNYFDDGYIGNFLGWMETGLNASHLTCPHFELFEGNQAFNIDGDDTWGGAVYNAFFRNHTTGKRRSFPDTASRRAIGLMYGHYFYSFVGNVMGTADQNPAPFSGFAYEDFYPWEDDPIGLWRLGYTPEDWNAPPDPLVVETVHRHANWDYATDSVHWQPGYDQTLPDSFYLAGKPPFFGDNPWPWVDATGATQLYTLPARARYDAGLPNPFTLIVAKAGNGSGTITSSPAGIDCGPTCSTSYTANTVVALTASPAAGSTFTGWGGACSGSGACQVTMNAPKLVTATFTQTGGGTQPLTVTKAGNGSGTVTSSPPGINCGPTCSASFPTGSVVSLTASAAPGVHLHRLGRRVLRHRRVPGHDGRAQDGHGHVRIGHPSQVRPGRQQDRQRQRDGHLVSLRHQLRTPVQGALPGGHGRHPDPDPCGRIHLRRLERRLLGHGSLRGHHEHAEIRHRQLRPRLGGRPRREMGPQRGQRLHRGRLFGQRQHRHPHERHRLDHRQVRRRPAVRRSRRPRAGQRLELARRHHGRHLRSVGVPHGRALRLADHPPEGSGCLLLHRIRRRPRKPARERRHLQRRLLHVRDRDLGASGERVDACGRDLRRLAAALLHERHPRGLAGCDRFISGQHELPLDRRQRGLWRALQRQAR